MTQQAFIKYLTTGICVFLAASFLWLAITRPFTVIAPPLPGDIRTNIKTRQAAKDIHQRVLSLTDHPFGELPPNLPFLPCDWKPQTFFRPTRVQASIHCIDSSSLISFKKVPSDTKPTLTTITDVSCLKRVIKDHCSDVSLRVPRIAHYVRFGNYNMTLDAFFSVLSVARFVRPCLVLFHGDTVPSGPYWRALLQLVPNMMHVRMQKPRKIWTKVINGVEHSSDVARIKLMQEFGGVYLDFDYLVLHPLDDLFNHSMVMGQETGNQFCNGFFIAEAKAEFLTRWLRNYTDFNDNQWAVHSTMRPFILSKDFPHLVHVVHTFFNPSYGAVWKYFNRTTTPPNYDWSVNYGVHLYTRLVRKSVYGHPRLDMQDNVVADMVRHILHGDPHACGHRPKV